MTTEQFNEIIVGEILQHIRSTGAEDVVVREHLGDKIVVAAKDMKPYQIDHRACRDLHLPQPNQH